MEYAKKPFQITDVILRFPSQCIANWRIYSCVMARREKTRKWRWIDVWIPKSCFIYKFYAYQDVPSLLHHCNIAVTKVSLLQHIVLYRHFQHHYSFLHDCECIRECFWHVNQMQTEKCTTSLPQSWTNCNFQCTLPRELSKLGVYDEINSIKGMEKK